MATSRSISSSFLGENSVSADYRLEFHRSSAKVDVRLLRGSILQETITLEGVSNTTPCSYETISSIAQSKIDQLLVKHNIPLIKSPAIKDSQDIDPKMRELNPNSERFNKKTAEFSPLPQEANVNWEESRMLTPGGLCGYKTKKGMSFYRCRNDGEVKLFTHVSEIVICEDSELRLVAEQTESQGLVFQNGQTQPVGASVTTAIKAETARIKETVSTYVQYDKTDIIQEGKDFYVNPENYQGKTFYQGGHLIDHQFSAEASHYDEENYFPVHFYYNSPLKNYLVDRCDAYVEIPLYSSNPPLIRVNTMGGKKPKEKIYHPIPAGIIFVQIIQGKIEDIYLFPNNDIDYKGLAEKLKSKKTQAASEAVLPCFKLKKSLQRLLQPAIIAELSSAQIGREDSFFQLVDDITIGMSLESCSNHENEIYQLSSAVLHKEFVDPFLCLDCTLDQKQELEHEPILFAYKMLGEFLVHYAINNAMKCETFSIKSRLTVLNVIARFIDNYFVDESKNCDRVFKHIDGHFNTPFRESLKGLYDIKDTMDPQEVLYLANTFSRLCNISNYDFKSTGHAIFKSEDFTRYFQKSVQIADLIRKNHDLLSFSHDLGWSFLNTMYDLQHTFDYLIETECPLDGKEEIEEEFQEEIAALTSLSDPCLTLLEKLTHEQAVVCVKFQIQRDERIKMRANVSDLEITFNNLGLTGFETV